MLPASHLHTNYICSGSATDIMWRNYMNLMPSTQCYETSVSFQNLNLLKDVENWLWELIASTPYIYVPVTGTLGTATCQIQHPIVMGLDKQHHYLTLMIDILCFPWLSTISSLGFFITISLSKNQSPPNWQLYQRPGKDYGRACRHHPKVAASLSNNLAYICKHSVFGNRGFLP